MKEETKEKKVVVEPQIKVVKSSAILKCILTEEEKRKLADDLAQEVEQVSRLEGELKALASEMKAKINEVDARLAKHASLFRQGYEYREVPIEIVKNFHSGSVSKTRMDTFAQYEERAMTGEERQQFLPLEPQKKPDDGNGTETDKAKEKEKK
jgi:uncharacterized protein (UPF0335 family)